MNWFSIGQLSGHKRKSSLPLRPAEHGRESTNTWILRARPRSAFARDHSVVPRMLSWLETAVTQISFKLSTNQNYLQEEAILEDTSTTLHKHTNSYFQNQDQDVRSKNIWFFEFLNDFVSSIHDNDFF